MHERFARRVKALRSRPRRVLPWVGLVAVLTVAVIYLVAFAPVFVLEDVDVTGGSDEVQARKPPGRRPRPSDRKSTRLNSSHPV